MDDQTGNAAPYLAAARGLAPLVDALRERFDSDRGLPLALVEALDKTDLLRMWVPRALGGPELDPIGFLTVIEELSRQDGSLGWCTVIPSGYSRLSGALSEDVARAMFGSGRGVLVGSLNPSGKAVAVPGGYRVSGKWGYGSFIAHSDWVLGNCIVEDPAGPRKAGDGGPELRLSLFPRDSVEVSDIWHVGGLRATGSNDYRVENLFVPESHTVPLIGFQPLPRRPEPLYAIPMTSTFVSCIATVMLGIARGAIDALAQIAVSKTSGESRTALRDKPLAQSGMAQAEALVGAGRAFLFDELGTMWSHAQSGLAIAMEERARVRLAACHAAQCAIQAVDLTYQLAGGAALFQSGRLERCFRDVHAAGQHIAVSPQANLEPIGRVLFGLPPGMARF
jgi:alkylation response protein AidB-like acyl-CoA dehydrogenase